MISIYVLIVTTIHTPTVYGFTVTLPFLCLFDYSYSPGGGTIDAVVTRCEVTRSSRGAKSQLNVSVVDAGLSDHHLLTWSLPARKSSAPTQTAFRRPWRKLDVG